eukprot:387588-Pelagomonas_calceolata.AAC.4
MSRNSAEIDGVAKAAAWAAYRGQTCVTLSVGFALSWEEIAKPAPRHGIALLTSQNYTQVMH